MSEFNFVEFLTKGDILFYWLFLCIQGLFLLYIFLALYMHRKDRKELERIVFEKEGVDIYFKDYCRCVELNIGHCHGSQPPRKDQPHG